MEKSEEAILGKEYRAGARSKVKGGAGKKERGHKIAKEKRKV